MSRFTDLPAEIRIRIIRQAIWSSPGVACWSCVFCTPADEKQLLEHCLHAGCRLPHRSDVFLGEPSQVKEIEQQAAPKSTYKAALWSLLATSRSTRAMIFSFGLMLHLCSAACFSTWTKTCHASRHLVFRRVNVKDWRYVYGDYGTHPEEFNARWTSKSVCHAFGMAVKCKKECLLTGYKVDDMKWNWNHGRIARVTPPWTSTLRLYWMSWAATVELGNDGDVLEQPILLAPNLLGVDVGQNCQKQCFDALSTKLRQCWTMEAGQHASR